MITELNQDQKNAMSSYVDKWVKIGLNTDPSDIGASKEYISEIYQSQQLTPPKYWFYFCDPYTCSLAIFMVHALSDFDDTYKSTQLHSDISKWESIFNDLYEQYSQQYKNIEWNDNVKTRMLSKVSKAFTEKNVSELLNSYLNNMIFGAHDAGWLSFYDFFHKEFNLDCVNPLVPYFNLAEVCGWWAAFSEVAFIQDRPSKIYQNDNKQMHNLNGPAIEYRNGYKVYAIENIVVPEYVVMDPNLITIQEINDEQNAEKRRVLLQQYGFERYFDNSDCTLIDHDEVTVATNDDRKMPRMLVLTKYNDMYLIGTDGSTKRKYFMNIYNSDNKNRIEQEFGKINTCKKAHLLISGLDESKCLAQS